jgi:hypothetical protein
MAQRAQGSKLLPQIKDILMRDFQKVISEDDQQKHKKFGISKSIQTNYLFEFKDLVRVAFPAILSKK